MTQAQFLVCRKQSAKYQWVPRLKQMITVHEQYNLRYFTFYKFCCRNSSCKVLVLILPSLVPNSYAHTHLKICLYIMSSWGPHPVIHTYHFWLCTRNFSWRAWGTICVFRSIHIACMQGNHPTFSSILPTQHIIFLMNSVSPMDMANSKKKYNYSEVPFTYETQTSSSKEW